MWNAGPIAAASIDSKLDKARTYSEHATNGVGSGWRLRPGEVPMVQLFLSVFFGFAMIAAVSIIATMIRSEWPRIAAILAGSQLEAARQAGSRLQIRSRGRAPAERSLSRTMLRAAA